MNETAKAMRRRFVEDKTGVFPWMRIFRGSGLDVGCGPDKLPFDNCKGFDKQDGDANDLTHHIVADSLNYIHGSQSLEHMIDPVAALNSWILCVKRGGYIICTVPDFVLYEQLNWPSRFNPDHKSTWSMWLTGSPAPIHCFLPDWLNQFPTKILMCRVVDTNYRYNLIGKFVDQTYVEDYNIEAFIEFVLKK